MARRLPRSTPLVLAAWWLGGCTLLPVQGPPIQEMSDARQAVAAAHEAGAGSYAGLRLGRAQWHLSRAEQALEGRWYEEARGEARLAKEEAVSARRVSIALRRAETSLAEAKRLDVDAGLAPELLSEARARAEAGDDSVALERAERALRVAEDGLNERYLDRARAVLAPLAPRCSGLGPDDLARYQAAQAAVTARDGRRAYELARGLPSAATVQASGKHRRPAANQPCPP